jgi:DNA polymerase III delta prime subunit
MFESVAPYQPKIAEALSTDISGGTLASSCLFAGPRHSLRMTTALETARLLSCGGDRSETCSCPSCNAFRTLSVDNVVILSQRDNASVVETAISLFAKNRTESSRIFLLRSTRIALMQYHGALLSSATSSQEASYDIASTVNDTLIALEGEKGDISEKMAKSYASDLRQGMKKLSASEKKDTRLSIAQVRSIAEWAGQTTVGGKKRFIILEGIEDANVASRNSLLKILEEPPKDVYFFLVSSHPVRIMPTILSRVRKYTFDPLEERQVRQLLSTLSPSSTYGSFDDFFLAESGVDISVLVSMAVKMEESMRTKQYLSGPDMDALIAQVDTGSACDYFLIRLLGCVESSFLEGRISCSQASVWEETISTMKSQGDLYNQNNKLLLQTLYLRLMEEAE